MAYEWTYGAVYSPKWVKGLTLSADWWHIDMRDIVTPSARKPLSWKIPRQTMARQPLLEAPGRLIVRAAGDNPSVSLGQSC